MIARPFIAVALLVVFFIEMVVSGATTAWLIVRPGRSPEPGLLRIRYSGIDPIGAAVLGAMITLTPGTTTIDVDVERGELLLHLLDASDPASVARSIRKRFERPCRWRHIRAAMSRTAHPSIWLGGAAMTRRSSHLCPSLIRITRLLRQARTGTCTLRSSSRFLCLSVRTETPRRRSRG